MYPSLKYQNNLLPYKAGIWMTAVVLLLMFFAAKAVLDVPTWR
jgi:hypothetical protein